MVGSGKTNCCHPLTEPKGNNLFDNLVIIFLIFFAFPIFL